MPDATTPRSVFSDHSDETNDRSLSSNVMILSRIRRLQNADFSSARGISGKAPGFFGQPIENQLRVHRIREEKLAAVPATMKVSGWWFGTFFIFHVVYIG